MNFPGGRRSVKNWAQSACLYIMTHYIWNEKKSEFQNIFWLNWKIHPSNQWHACEIWSCRNRARIRTNWCYMPIFWNQFWSFVCRRFASECPGLRGIWAYRQCCCQKDGNTSGASYVYSTEKSLRELADKSTSYFHSRRKALASCFQANAETPSKQS